MSESPIPSRAALAARIDHTILKADATPAQVDAVCTEALELGCASVCVNGSFVSRVASRLVGSKVRTCAVLGFPLGAMSTSAKVAEARSLVADGARELDMVIAVGLLKAGLESEVAADIAAVVRAAGSAPVKVILETCLLTDAEKIRACELAVESGAAFVKTSTGFSTGGATLDDVRLMRRTVGSRCRVKASGGIRDTATALAMIEAGADRLGLSASVAIVRGLS
jgi:deoxyribose-phosphate aldolase